MSARWDRFSWFGLLPVSETGKLGTLPVTFEAAKLIPALEAILIEALEPRQNRKRGDDLAAVEYIQRVDPEIEKKKIKATLDAALAGLSLEQRRSRFHRDISRSATRASTRVCHPISCSTTMSSRVRQAWATTEPQAK